jgi:hypothetical protein
MVWEDLKTIYKNNQKLKLKKEKKKQWYKEGPTQATAHLAGNL